jgi:hypothetical protein
MRLSVVMHKKRILLVPLVVVVGIAAVLWALPRRPAVSLTTIVHLSPGMSEADVAMLLGPPTADVTARPPAGLPPAAPGGKLLQYVGDRATATVEFDPGGRVVRVHPVIRTVTGIERVRLRLNWWW